MALSFNSRLLIVPEVDLGMQSVTMSINCPLQKKAFDKISVEMSVSGRMQAPWEEERASRLSPARGAATGT